MLVVNQNQSRFIFILQSVGQPTRTREKRRSSPAHTRQPANGFEEYFAASSCITHKPVSCQSQTEISLSILPICPVLRLGVFTHTGDFHPPVLGVFTQIHPIAHLTLKQVHKLKAELDRLKTLQRGDCKIDREMAYLRGQMKQLVRAALKFRKPIAM